MKTKKIFITFFLSLCFVFLSYGQTEFRHGLILNGGSGSLRDVELSPSDEINNYIIKYGGTGYTKYQLNIGIGYKFRIQPQTKPFFFDMDLNIGARKYKYSYSATYKNDTITEGYSCSGDNMMLYGSINASFNYTLYKGLYAGIGLEPTLYFASLGGMLDKFVYDMPVTAKIGYDFRFIDISVGYKYGLFNAMKVDDNYKSGKMNEWQIQLFIPF